MKPRPFRQSFRSRTFFSRCIGFRKKIVEIAGFHLFFKQYYIFSVFQAVFSLSSYFIYKKMATNAASAVSSIENGFKKNESFFQRLSFIPSFKKGQIVAFVKKACGKEKFKAAIP